jgi:hypothetical protein
VCIFCAYSNTNLYQVSLAFQIYFYSLGLSMRWFVIGIDLHHYSLGLSSDWGGFLRGFCSSRCFGGNRFPLVFIFFFPPKLVSASCTGLLVNNILPSQKKKNYFYYWISDSALKSNLEIFSCFFSACVE